LLWLVLRELDLQKAFTYRSIESVGFYTRAIAPWWQKVLAIALLIPFVVALLHLFWLAARNLLPAVAQRRPWLGHCVAIAFLALITVLCEKALESTVLEEVCELGLAFLVFLFTLDASSWKSTPDVLPAPNPLA
jgi:hypothetical protein